MIKEPLENPMTKVEIRNAKIDYTKLGVEDHGIMTFSLCLDYGGAGQCAGGYALDKPVHNSENEFIRREGGEHSMQIIMLILKALKVDNWEDLKGKQIRVKASQTKVHAISHYLDDTWLDFEEFFKRYR